MKESCYSLWRRMDKDARREVLTTYTNSLGEDGLPSRVAAEIAQRVRFRQSMVRRARGDQLIRLLDRAISSGDENLATTLLVGYFMTDRADVLSEVYDALGVAHSGIEIDDAAAEQALDDAVIDAAIKLAAADPGRQVGLCFEVLNLNCFPKWKPTISRIAEGIRRQGCSVDKPTPAVSGPAAREQEISTRPALVTGAEQPEAAVDDALEQLPLQEPEEDSPEFTTLDRVLVRAILSALNRVEGSLSYDELDDLVLETLELNDSRFQSFFHRGFLDALLERELQPMGPGENSQRRAWYLVGFCQGLMRRKGNPAGARFMAHLSDSDREALLGNPEGTRAGEFMMPLLIRPLLDNNHLATAESWIGVYLARTAARSIEPIVTWARMAPLATDPDRIARILEASRQAIGQIPEGPHAPPRSIIDRLMRRYAIALRLQGKVSQAEAIVDGLLESERDGGPRSKLLGDKILCRMGKRSLEDLRIGKNETREALAAALESVSSHIEAALREPSGSTSVVTNYAAGIRVILSKNASDPDLHAAAVCLRHAITGLELWNFQFWKKNGVLPRARFYLSIVELRLIDQSEAAPAATRLISLLEDGLDEPLDLVIDAVDHAVFQDLPEADRLAREALRRWPQVVLARLDVRGLVRRSRLFREKIIEALEANDAILTAEERWSAWCSLLEGALAADERDIDAAQLALDTLEGLAEHHGLVDRFIELLGSTGNWSPAWAPMDVEMAKYRLFEATGQLDEARAILPNIAHQAISDGHGDAHELIVRLHTLGMDPLQTEDLRRRLELASAEIREESEAEPLASDQPVAVFFIGGDETQVAYQHRITDWLAENHPGCKVKFEFTCWSSNWGRELTAYRHAIEEADAVVLMRFIRTHLGRYVRKTAGELSTPWVPCTGRGHDSMVRAIERAIRVARR